MPAEFAANLALVRRYQQGDAAAAEALLALNLPLIHAIARRYATVALGMEYEDLLQEGKLGLLRAAAKFEPAHGCVFSTYATHWIRQAISRAARKGRLIAVPDHARSEENLPAVLSLDQPLGQDGSEVFADLLPAPGDLEAEAVERLSLRARLAALKPQERRVLELRFGLAGGPALTLQETGAQLRRSKQRVDQVQRRALQRLREAAAGSL